MRPAIASDGSDYLVVWQAAANSLRAGRFRPGTGPLDGPEGFLIAQGGQRQVGAPRLAFGNGTYLVAWVDLAGPFDSLLKAIEISPAGTIANLQILRDGVSPPNVSVAYSGGAYVVTYLGPGAGKVPSLLGVLIRP